MDDQEVMQEEVQGPTQYRLVVGAVLIPTTDKMEPLAAQATKRLQEGVGQHIWLSDPRTLGETLVDRPVRLTLSKFQGSREDLVLFLMKSLMRTIDKIDSVIPSVNGPNSPGFTGSLLNGEVNCGRCDAPNQIKDMKVCGSCLFSFCAECAGPEGEYTCTTCGGDEGSRGRSSEGAAHVDG